MYFCTHYNKYSKNSIMRILSFIILTLLVVTACSTTKKNTANIDNSNDETKEVSSINTQARDALLIKQGFDFVAFGNEPFWTLRVDFDKKTAEFEEMNKEIAVFKINTNDKNHIEAIEYLNNKIDFKVDAIERICYDNMSGEGFNYKISIDINSKKMYGCGKYLSDAMVTPIDKIIFGNWKLIELANKHIPEDNKANLNILNNNRIGGFSSCNSYGGNYSIEGKNISFSDILSTKRYCSKSIERDYFSALGRVTEYKIKDGKLILLNKNGSIELMFSK